MTDSNFTPGPWEKEDLNVYRSGCGGCVANISKVAPKGRNGDKDSIFAEMEANARLIAAAPDLLEASEMAYDYFCTYFSNDPPVKVVLRAAIAKAKGVS